MPTIAVIVVYYRFNEPDGIRLLIDRDSENENLADVMYEARKRFDEGYAAFIRAGGSRNGAIYLLDRQLREAGRIRSFKLDPISAVNVIGGIDMLERLGALKRDIYNGVYVAFTEKLPDPQSPV